MTDGRLKLVKDVLALVETAQFGSQVFMHQVRFHRLVIHIQVPNFDGKIVSSDHIPAITGELQIGYQRYEIRKETRAKIVLGILKICNRINC